jgi:TP901 family phage tail tape measure protein
MALDDRRTSVTIDLTVGSIQLPEGVVEVPARLQLERAPGGDGAGGDGGADGLMGALDQLASALGVRAVRRLRALVASLRALSGAMGVAATAAAPFIGAIVAIVAVLAWFIWRATVLIGLLRQVATAFTAASRAIYNANKQIIAWLRAPVEATIRRSIAVLRQFHDKLKEYVEDAVRRSIDILRQYFDMLRDGFREAYGHIREFVGGAVEGFAQFEQDVQNTVVVMGEFGDAGVKMRRTLVDDITRITVHSRRMGSEAAQAMYAIASAGWGTRQELNEIAKASILLSEATLQDLIPTTESLMATLNRFRLPAREAERAVNVMTAAISKSPATMPKLEASLRYLGVTASAFGETLESTTALLMGFYKMGYQGSTAGMELAYALTQLSQQGKKFRDIAEGMGMDLAKLQPATHSFVEILEEFEKAQERVGETTMKLAIAQMFGLRSARAMRTALLVGSQAFRDMERNITGTNLAAQMQADQLNTLQGQWMILRSRLERGAFVFGNVLEPSLRRVIGYMNEMAQQTLDVGLFERFGGILAGGVDRLLAVISPLSGPGFRLAWELLDILEETFVALGDAAQAAVPSVRALMEAIPGVIREVSAQVMPAFIGAIETIGPFLVEWVKTITPKMAELVAHVLHLVTAFVDMGQGTILRWFSTLLDMLVTVVQYITLNIPSALTFIEALVTGLPVLLHNFLGVLTQVLRLGLAMTPIWMTFVAALMQFATIILVQHGDKVLQWFVGLMQMVLRVAGALLQLGPVLQQYLDLLMNQLANVLTMALAHLPVLVELFEELLDNIEAFAKTYLPLLDEVLKQVLSLVGQLLSGALPAWLYEFGGNLDKMLNIVEKIADTFRWIISLIEQMAPKMGPMLEMLDKVLGFLSENLKKILLLLIDVLLVKLRWEALKLFGQLVLAGAPLLGARVWTMSLEVERMLQDMRRTLADMPEPPSWGQEGGGASGAGGQAAQAEMQAAQGLGPDPRKPQRGPAGHDRPNYELEDAAQKAGERRATRLNMGGARHEGLA